MVLQEDNIVLMKWPLARVVDVHTTGNDGLVRVVTVKTSAGTYKRPITKIALLISPHFCLLIFKTILSWPAVC